MFKNIKDIDGLFKGKINGKIVDRKVHPLGLGDSINNGGELFGVQVTVDENGKEKVIEAVAKLIPPTEEKQQEFNIQSTFKNEMGFYDDIVPLLQDFQRECGISSVADYFPKLYGARTTLKPNSDDVDQDGVILLENLKIAGYENIDKGQGGFDLEETKLILRVLANLQATVIGIKQNKPDIFSSKIEPKLKMARPKPKDGNGRPKFNLNQHPLKLLGDVLKENPNTSSLIPTINHFLENPPERTIREPWATIVHNDLWINNIMLKEKITDMSDVKLIDFQMLNHGSPAIDFTFFLFSSVQTTVLKYHFEKLVQYYYNQLIENLQRFKLDVKKFSYESFQEELNKVAGDQIFHAILMLMNTIFGENNPKIGKSPGLPFICKEKIWFIIEEAVKRNWI